MSDPLRIVLVESGLTGVARLKAELELAPVGTLALATGTHAHDTGAVPSLSA